MVRIELVFICFLVLSSASFAHDGYVLNEAGGPIYDATVCYIVPGTEADGICANTNEKGFYSLPGDSPLRLRVWADGYLEKTVPSAERKLPVVLELGANVWIKTIDANSGEPIADASVYLVLPNGRKRGRAYTNEAGVKIGPLPAGEVIVEAMAMGYSKGKSEPRRLLAGQETIIEVKLVPND